MKVKTITNTVFIHKLMFVDGTAFSAQRESKLQEICGTFSASCDLLSLKNSAQKTVSLATTAPPPCI